MEKDKKQIGEKAAETPTVLNPLTAGVSHKELRSAAISLWRNAIANPGRVAKHSAKLLKEDWDILMGNSEREPNARDRRFQDPAWKANPIYHRSLQHWLAMSDHFEAWVNDLELGEIQHARAKFVTQMVSDALAPSNYPLRNPSFLKQLIDTGGGSLVRGSKNLLSDVRDNGGMPSQVDKSKFKLGENIATTPGKVIWRNHLLELIHYRPVTDKVREVPYLCVPPQINKFYVFDLSPEKSLVQFLLSEGFQCFWISWRNPSKKDAEFGLKDYVDAVIEAMDVVSGITKSKKINVGGACSGGITTATIASYLASLGDERINSLSFKVCVLDPKPQDNEIGQLVSERGLEAARKASKRKGVLKGDELARVFAWMRPNDLIWNYYVNNYLMGESPPAFDILYWNNDTTNLAAKLHSDFLDLNLKQVFAHPGEVTIAEHKADLTKVDCDAYIVAGLTDHITPWKACYRTTRLLGSKNIEFILSSSGHIQALVNPPGNPRAKFLRGAKLNETAEGWLADAEETSGSWWSHWATWLHDRSGEMKPAPKRIGTKKYPALCDAPGEYVLG